MKYFNFMKKQKTKEERIAIVTINGLNEMSRQEVQSLQIWLNTVKNSLYNNDNFTKKTTFRFIK